MGSFLELFKGRIFLLVFLTLCTLDLVHAQVGESKEEEEIVVKVETGKVRGTVETSAYSQRPFYSFKGIPYAKPPLGPLRWRAPVKAEPWDEILDGTKYSEVCPQLSEDSNEVIDGDENCLFVNVFTPNIKEKHEYPVVILIHGGSFLYESGSQYNPDYLMEEDLVVVTFNFRLGILGFFSTGSDGVIQGNAGLKDQVLLMKWVRDNIRNFNGNPNKVTLLGISSGSASVHLHMISPMSEGLFHQAISQSGTAFCPWAIVRTPEIRVDRVAKLVNCTQDTNELVKECLLHVPAKDLIHKQPAFGEWYIDPIVPVGPVIEGKNGQDPVFLPDSPYRLVKKGQFQKDIPWLVGINSHEGLLHSADIVSNGILIRVINFEWKDAAPITLLYKYTTMDSNATSKAILNYYFNGEKINATNLDNLTNMYSDRYFFHGTYRAVKAHINNGADAPIFLYYFDYVGDNSLIHLSSRNKDKDVKGVGHYDQIQYLFKLQGFPEITEQHHEFSKKFINTLTHFIKSGKPGDPGQSTKWRAVDSEDFEEGRSLKYNVIGSIDGTIDDPFKERMSFWDHLILLELDKEVDTAFIESFIKSQEKTEL